MQHAYCSIKPSDFVVKLLVFSCQLVEFGLCSLQDLCLSCVHIRIRLRIDRLILKLVIRMQSTEQGAAIRLTLSEVAYRALL